MQTSDPHYREAAAAIAGMADTYGWTPRPGDRVRCPRAFGGGYQDGLVFGPDERMGWLVDTAEGRLLMFADELELLTDQVVAMSGAAAPVQEPSPLTAHGDHRTRSAGGAG